MDSGTSFLQAIAALLIVIGLIYLTGWILRRFSFGGGLALGPRTAKTDKRLKLLETLWLDARYRLVLVEDGAKTHTILLGPQQALQLTNNAHLSQATANAPPSNLPHP